MAEKCHKQKIHITSLTQKLSQLPNKCSRETDRQTDQRLAGIICTMQVLDTDSSVRARRVLISQEKNLVSKIKNLKN